MTFVRGFKSDCERLVNQLRNEMSVPELAPFDMELLASHLEIPVHPLSDYVAAARLQRSSAHLDEIYKSVSAFTFFSGSHRTIVFNDEHVPVRHRSNMAHELAHALLGHPPASIGLSSAQHKLHEHEASWLGGVLMLSAHQAQEIAYSGMGAALAMAHYRVSPQMLRYRMNVTGASRLATTSKRA